MLSRLRPLLSGTVYRTVRFREMAPEELPKIVAIERKSYLFPWSEQIFRSCIRHRDYACRVAEVEGEIVGYGILSLGAGEAHVMNLCVAPEWRGRGIGRAILTHLLQLAREAGAKEVFLEVRPSNRRALQLYRRMGFVEVGTRRGYYPAEWGREDAIVMAKPLSPSHAPSETGR